MKRRLSLTASTLATTVFLLSLARVDTATGYINDVKHNKPVKWESDSVYLSLSNYSFPDATTQGYVLGGILPYDDNYLFNYGYGVGFQVQYGIDYCTTNPTNNDGVNMIAVVSNLGTDVIGVMDPNYYASVNCPLTDWSCYKEVDVYLNTNNGLFSFASVDDYDWHGYYIYDTPFDHGDGEFSVGVYPWDIERCIMHEMGHVVGLEEQKYAPVVMNPNPGTAHYTADTGWLDRYWYSVTADELEFLRDTYPGSGGEDLPDYAASSQIWHNEGEEFSLGPGNNVNGFEGCVWSERTRPSPIPEPNNPDDWSCTYYYYGIDPLDPLTVAPADVIEDIEFTIWNLGDSSGTVVWTLVISLDDQYDSGDVNCASDSVYIKHGEYYELNTDMEVCTFIEGEYYLILRVNPSELYPESVAFEVNNQAVWNR